MITEKLRVAGRSKFPAFRHCYFAVEVAVAAVDKTVQYGSVRFVVDDDAPPLDSPFFSLERSAGR